MHDKLQDTDTIPALQTITAAATHFKCFPNRDSYWYILYKTEECHSLHHYIQCTLNVKSKVPLYKSRLSSIEMQEHPVFGHPHFGKLQANFLLQTAKQLLQLLLDEQKIQRNKFIMQNTLLTEKVFQHQLPSSW